MTDLLFIGISLLFFLSALGLVRLGESLKEK